MDNNDRNTNHEQHSSHYTVTSTQNTEHAEPVTHQTQTVRKHSEQLGARSIVAAIFGFVAILISIRFVLKLFGANVNNGFVQFMNAITGFFVNLFKGIFVERSIGGGSAVFEPASLVALIIVALIAWFVLRLMTRNNDKRTEQTSVTSGTKPENMQ